MNVIHLAIGLCVAHGAVALAADDAHVQDVAFTAKVDGTTQRYVILRPAGFRDDEPCDVLIALHGHGSDRWQFVRDERPECRAARDTAAKHGMLYVSPDYRAKTSWMGPKAEADLVQIIGEIKSRFHVRHVYLCGGSMGGASSLTFTALHPELIDGVAAMNGTGNTSNTSAFRSYHASFGGSKARSRGDKKRAPSIGPSVTMPVGLRPAARTSRCRRRACCGGEVFAELGRPVRLIYRGTAAQHDHTTTPRDPRIRHQRSDGYGASYARANEEARRANGFVLRFAGVHHGGAEDTEKRTES